MQEPQAVNLSAKVAEAPDSLQSPYRQPAQRTRLCPRLAGCSLCQMQRQRCSEPPPEIVIEHRLSGSAGLKSFGVRRIDNSRCLRNGARVFPILPNADLEPDREYRNLHWPFRTRGEFRSAVRSPAKRASTNENVCCVIPDGDSSTRHPLSTIS